MTSHLHDLPSPRPTRQQPSRHLSNAATLIASLILVFCPTQSAAYSVPSSWLSRPTAGAASSTRHRRRSHSSPMRSILNNPRSHSCTSISLSSSNDNVAFDESAYESDRLSKDALAMKEMKMAAEEEYSKLRTPWKWKIRRAVWDYMEDNDIAQFPRPVHHRIPNFINADIAANNLATLPQFQSAKIVKVNPDTPQRQVRHLVLQSGKTLLTPQPRLRTGFFSTLGTDDTPPGLPIEALTSSKGAAQYGTPVTLYESYNVDLVVVGSTAVCPTTGARVGKGEGFAELEWGILTQQGNLDAEKVLVVTTVHDCQVFDGGVEEPWKSLMETAATASGESDAGNAATGSGGGSSTVFGALTQHDVPVDIIVTPTRIIHVSDRLPKPSGVYWDLLSPQKLAQIRVLQQLKKTIEDETGEALPSGPEEVLPPIAERGRGGRGRGGRGGRGRGRGGRGGGRGRGGRGQVQGRS